MNDLALQAINAQYAYKSEGELTKASNQGMLPATMRLNYYEENDAGAQVFVATDRLADTRTVVAAMAGTNDDLDFVTDIKCWREPFQLNQSVSTFAYVHKGFLDHFRSIKTNWVRAILDLDPEEIICTGHSLGGTGATFLALYLSSIGYKCRLYTYGAPRQGDADFAELAQRHIYSINRVTLGLDPVPHLVPVTLGYRHISRNIHLAGGGGFKTALGTVLPVRWLIKQHKIAAYVKATRGY